MSPSGRARRRAFRSRIRGDRRGAAERRGEAGADVVGNCRPPMVQPVRGIAASRVISRGSRAGGVSAFSPIGTNNALSASRSSPICAAPRPIRRRPGHDPAGAAIQFRRALGVGADAQARRFDLLHQRDQHQEVDQDQFLAVPPRREAAAASGGFLARQPLGRQLPRGETHAAGLHHRQAGDPLVQ